MSVKCHSSCTLSIYTCYVVHQKTPPANKFVSYLLAVMTPCGRLA